MASKGIEVRLVLVLLVIIFSAGGIMAQPSCTSAILSMASCLNYVTGSSPTPPASCCSALANVVQTNPRCLCTVLDGGAQLGVSINSTLALSLPKVCKVETPPVEKCKEANGPAISPVGSPENAPGPAGSADQSPDSPSVTGSKATPGSATASNGSVTKMQLQMIGFLVVLVSIFSKFSCI